MDLFYNDMSFYACWSRQFVRLKSWLGYDNILDQTQALCGHF